MSGILLPILIVFLLICLNGVFAMSEIAIVSSKQARLQHLADEGNSSAESVLKLIDQPNRFLSTVQVGITLIGILAGAYGEKNIAQTLTPILAQIPFIGEFADSLSLLIVVASITFFSVVVGELVPKRLGMLNAERIAVVIARPMQTLSWIATPFVALLSGATELALRLLGAANIVEAPVSEEEIKILVGQGVQAGIIEAEERRMVESVFRFGDRRLETLMTPRTEIAWLDINATDDEIRELVTQNIFSRYLVCDGELDRVIGFVRAKDLLTRIWAGEPANLRETMREPLLLPETMLALPALERFRESGVHIGILLGEFGGVEGVVTLIDILEALVGDIPTSMEIQNPPIVQREDGSYLIDALILIEDFKDRFDVEVLPNQESYQTLGGFVLLMLGRIPQAGDLFEWGGWRFEVVDMDGKRVDKVLMEKAKS